MEPTFLHGYFFAPIKSESLFYNDPWLHDETKNRAAILAWNTSPDAQIFYTGTGWIRQLSMTVDSGSRLILKA